MCSLALVSVTLLFSPRITPLARFQYLPRGFIRSSIIFYPRYLLHLSLHIFVYFLPCSPSLLIFIILHYMSSSLILLSTPLLYAFASGLRLTPLSPSLVPSLWRDSPTSWQKSGHETTLPLPISRSSSTHLSTSFGFSCVMFIHRFIADHLPRLHPPHFFTCFFLLISRPVDTVPFLILTFCSLFSPIFSFLSGVSHVSETEGVDTTSWTFHLPRSSTRHEHLKPVLVPIAQQSGPYGHPRKQKKSPMQLGLFSEGFQLTDMMRFLGW